MTEPYIETVNGCLHVGDSVLEALGYPDYLRFTLTLDLRGMYIQGTKRNEYDSIEVPAAVYARNGVFGLNGPVIERFVTMIGLQAGKTYRFYGQSVGNRLRFSLPQEEFTPKQNERKMGENLAFGEAILRLLASGMPAKEIAVIMKLRDDEVKAMSAFRDDISDYTRTLQQRRKRRQIQGEA